ncbi:hypothetical protein [Aminobacter sp. LjRoot7]
MAAEPQQEYLAKCQCGICAASMHLIAPSNPSSAIAALAFAYAWNPKQPA